MAICILLSPSLPFYAWQAGYRWTALPYRDWEPPKDERDRVRRVPGTAYHVVLRRDALTPRVQHTS